MISAHGLRIRPITRGDLPLIQSWNDAKSRGPYQEFTFSSPQRMDHDFEETGFLSENFQMLLIEIEGIVPIGLIYINFVRDGLVRLGVVISKEDARGKGYGALATRLIVEYLFMNHPIVRVEAETDVENIGAQRVLEKAGFQREGVLRSYRYHHGEWRDFVMYSILSRDFPSEYC